MAIPQEVLQRLPEVHQILKMFRGNGHGPLVGISLSIDMKVRTTDFRVVRVPVRGSAQIKSDQDDHLPAPMLVSYFRQIDPAASQVEQELLGSIR